jgi:hypothetical protein
MSTQRRLTRGFGLVAKEVARDRSISAPARCLYMILATYADDHGECYPLNETLRADLGTSDSTVRRLQAELIEKGVLTREERTVEGRRTSSLFTLTDISVSERPPTSGRVPPPTGAQNHRPSVGDITRPSNNTTMNNTKHASRATGAPDSFLVDPELVRWASEELGITSPEWLQAQVNEFLDWARASGRKYVRWGPAVKNNLRRAAERAGRSRLPAPSEISEEELEAGIRQWTWDNPLRPDDDLIQAHADDPGEYHRRMQELTAERRKLAEAAVRRELQGVE